ncbi:MAG: DUF4912 domain-containing protein [Spirochaetia bacterium]|nr:DUF4912 domain-containing protein [Spirochaetia bacterium]
MTVDMYKSLSIEELQQLTTREGVKAVDRYNREELIEILEEIWEEKIADRKLNNDIMRLKGKKYDIYREDLNENYKNNEYVIPEHYPKTYIQLLLRDPYWAYAYWDINQFDLKTLLTKTPEPEFFLRVYEMESKTTEVEDSLSSFEIPVKAEDSSWYINLPTPGRWYQVDLVYFIGAENEELLCRSHMIESPGGYWLNRGEELRKDPDAFKLFLSGVSDSSGHISDNILIQKILADMEESRNSSNEV